MTGKPWSRPGRAGQLRAAGVPVHRAGLAQRAGNRRPGGSRRRSIRVPGPRPGRGDRRAAWWEALVTSAPGSPVKPAVRQQVGGSASMVAAPSELPGPGPRARS